MSDVELRRKQLDSGEDSEPSVKSKGCVCCLLSVPWPARLEMFQALFVCVRT